MVLNYIWIAFFVIAFILGLVRLVFFGDTGVFPAMMNSTFDMAKTGFEISLGLTGVMTLWMGLMRVGEQGGIVEPHVRAGGPFSASFPGNPEGPSCHRLHHDEHRRQHAGAGQCGHSAGAEGHDRAAGDQPGKGHGLQCHDHVPGAERLGADHHPGQHHGFPGPARRCRSFRYFYPHPAGHFLLHPGRDHCRIPVPADQPAEQGGPGLPGGFHPAGVRHHLVFHHHPPGPDQHHFLRFGQYHPFVIIISFIVLAFFKKINVYETFIEGAKDGFSIAVKIIPYLVAILVAVGVFRASGAMDFLVGGIGRLWRSWA